MIPPIIGGYNRNLLCLCGAVMHCKRLHCLFSTLHVRVLKYIIALILYLSRGKCNVVCIFVGYRKGRQLPPLLLHRNDPVFNTRFKHKALCLSACFKVYRAYAELVYTSDNTVAENAVIQLVSLFWHNDPL